MRTGSIAARILNLGTRGRYETNCIPRWNSPLYPTNRGMVSSREVSDAVVKRKTSHVYPIIEPRFLGRLAHNLVNMALELSRLHSVPWIGYTLNKTDSTKCLLVLAGPLIERSYKCNLNTLNSLSLLLHRASCRFTKYHTTNKGANFMSFILNHFFKTLFIAPTCFDSASLVIIIREHIEFLAKITC